MTPEISVQELESLRLANADIFLLDVRNPDEYEICNLNGYLIPFNELSKRLDEIPRDKHIIIHCHGGGRSQRATKMLLENGFKQVDNLRGGIMAWANEVDPTLAKY